MTLRGTELLGRADVVVYDSLVNPEIVRLAPPDAEIIFHGKRPGEACPGQDALNRLLISKAREGKTVIRLKGGDPFVFGRGGEEAAELAEAGIPFEVVAGVSSFSAVPAYAGIPLTHRDWASSFAVFTGHEDPHQEMPDLDWAGLARAPGTKVVLMGVKTLRHVADSLLGQGMAPTTPAAAVRWGTTSQQVVVEASLGTIADAAEAAALTPPAVIVIGEVVRLREKLNWFERRPLFGQRIVVTRARAQVPPLRQLLREAGAEVWEMPMIQFGPPTERQPLVEALAGLNGYDWLVFTSANGVGFFFEHFFRAFNDLRDLGGARLAAVGPATAARLRELHLQVDAQPTEFLGARLAEAMAEQGSLENLRILLLRAEVAQEEVVRVLEDHGAIVDDISCYRTTADTSDADGLNERLRQEGAHWITFTSGSTVGHFHDRFDLAALRRRFPHLRLASIGPETTKALNALDLNADAEAQPHTIEGLVETIVAKSQR
jgi:uroporphyrinogen III methyltransferase/synthase